MNIQELVPDLSICQEAKEKGVEIESHYLWAEYNPIGSTGVKTRITQDEDNVINESFGTPKFYPTPLTDEILEKLPKYLEPENEDGECILVISFWGGAWNVKYDYFNSPECSDKKLSNALLRLAIKLKEENII